MIRRAFAAAFFQRRRKRGSRTAGHVTNEQIAFAQVVAAGTGTSNASPTLSVRKAPQIPSIKHVQMKIQECNGSRIEKPWNYGVLPQFEGHHHSGCTVEINSEVVPQAVAADSPVRTHASSLIRHEKPSNEALSKEFFTYPEDGDIPANLDHRDNDGTGTSPTDHITTQKPQGLNHQMLLSKKGDDIFQIPKVCSHKKLRSRKAHKILIPPEALLSFTESTGAIEISRHLIGPTMKQYGNPAAPEGCSESSKDDKCGDEAYSDPGCQRVLAKPAITSVVGALSNDQVGEDKFPYSSTMSGSSNNFCTPEIEDWGNLK